jgi:hypothetical protein
MVVVSHIARFARSGNFNYQQHAAYTQKRAQWSAFSVLAVIAAFITASAMASLAVPTNVAESVAGVGLEGASLRAVVVGLRAVAVVVGLRAVGLSAVVVRLQSAVDNADEGIRAVATAHRFDANGAENQSARDENSGKRSVDRWTHDNLSFSALQSCRNS